MAMIYINHIYKIDKALISVDSYLKNLPFIRFSRKLVFDNPVTFFVGENGSGKSTLLEAIAINYGFNPEGGSKNFNFETRQTHSELHKLIKMVKSFAIV